MLAHLYACWRCRRGHVCPWAAGSLLHCGRLCGACSLSCDSPHFLFCALSPDGVRGALAFPSVYCPFELAR
uniref:Uncharacterized protein n=1 Tax=Leishmania guyanensis TaxID=5670 RepID=A0A1E1JA99_LEIGU|nr:Hypothetical protein BN36_NA76200 [Leishmania guyanensis]